MIRLLVSDVDGTLVRESSGEINPEYFSVIEQLNKRNIQVVLASGRPYSSMKSLFEPVDHLLWYIADGGATIKTTGELKNVSTIPTPWVKELWADIAKIPSADGMMCGKNAVYIPVKDSPMCEIVRDQYKMKVEYLNGWENLPPEGVGKMSLFCLERVEAFAQEYLLPKWKDRLYTVISGEWWFDLMMPDLNKAKALELILSEFQYTPHEVLATGDNMNDLELLRLAGTALAVSSARDEVKAVADRVIPNFEEDGVLNEWKKFLKESPLPS